MSLKARWLRDGEEVEDPGAVGDISANGVYFVLSHSRSPESQEEFFIPLKTDDASNGGVLLHCVCSVLRVEEKAAERIGVAARAYVEAKKHGGSLKLAGPSQFVSQALRSVLMANIKESFKDENAAVASFK